METIMECTANESITVRVSKNWTADESVTVSEHNNSTSSVFVTGKEEKKRVAIKIVTGAETTSTPNPRRDESSVDRDNYVGVFVTRDIEPVLTMEWTAEETVSVSEHNKSASSVFVTGKEEKKRVSIKIVTGTETTSSPNHRRDASSVETDNYVGVF